MMRAEIREAKSSADKAALYSFRYSIYVDEMNRKQKYANHSERRIEDPLDVHGRNLIAERDGEIIGCVRINMGGDPNAAYYASLLKMADVGADFPNRVSLCTRLMVSKELRGSPLATRLSIASFIFGLRNDVIWNFVDCNDHLVEFFSRLGYERTHRAVHDEYGPVNAMRLNIRDLAHLAAVKSIFASHLRAHERQLAEA